jgi:hypothetical protein
MICERKTHYSLYPFVAAHAYIENGGVHEQMKIIFEPKTYKIVKGAILLIAVAMVAYVGYAATQLTLNNSGTVVLATKNWQGITFSPPSSQPNCAIQTGYSDTPSPITWGSISQASSANGYICVKNLGGTGSSYTVTTSVAPAAGITVTYNGTSTLTSLAQPTGQTSVINVVVSVVLTASTGSFTYTTTIS